MKKLMTALTICAVASYAAAVDVTSPNVVGYQTVGFVDQAFVGDVFQNLATPGGSFSGTEVVGLAAVAGDSINVFNSSAFDFDQYVYGGEETGWIKIPVVGDPEVTSAPEFLIGQGALLVRSGATNLTFSGQVPQGTFTNQFLATVPRAFSSQLPVDVYGSTFVSFMQGGDAVYVFEPASYDFVQFVADGEGAIVKIPVVGDPEMIDVGTTVVLPVGVGGLFVPSGTGATRNWVQTFSL